MSHIKKSFNMDNDLAQRMDDFIGENPGVSATFILNQALKQWLENPSIKLNRKKASDDDVDKFLRDNSELMSKLAK